ncbi:MAG: 16S rRNA (guanine(527)-N(7))-methyltransferase RsmG [Thermoleophilia bacterium]
MWSTSFASTAPTRAARSSRSPSSATPEPPSDLQAYAALLTSYRRANVTGARGSPAGVAELIDDALALLDVDELARVSHDTDRGPWADLGSGGGLPGIPLALALPDVRLTLIEAVGKKCVFLREAVAQAGLTGRVEVACARSEELAAVGSPGRERYALVLAKAVGPLAVVVELASPLLRQGGLLLVSKTAAAAAPSPSAAHPCPARSASCSRRSQPRRSAFRGVPAWRPSDRWSSGAAIAEGAPFGARRWLVPASRVAPVAALQGGR